MPQTRPRGLTGSVTTGRTADPRTHARTLSHTPRARSVVWVVGAGFVWQGGREAW